MALIRQLLAEHVPEFEVRAFGSRYIGKAKKYSDLDLVLVGPGRIDIGRLGKLKEAFEESDLPYRVDLLDWNAISEEFKNVIKRGYAIIQNP